MNDKEWKEQKITKENKKKSIGYGLPMYVLGQLIGIFISSCFGSLFQSIIFTFICLNCLILSVIFAMYFLCEYLMTRNNL